MGILDRILSLFPQNKQANQRREEEEPQRKQSRDYSVDQRGHVIRKEDLGSIEAHGIKLKASIEVRKYTEEETKANAKDNQWYFEPAFWKVAKGIQANKASLNALLPELLVAHTSGDPRQEQNVVMQHLPEGSWYWPIYEDYVLKEASDEYTEEMEGIKNSDLSELLNCLKTSELRDLYKKNCCEKGKSPGNKKSDIITSIMESIDETSAATLVETLRSRLIEELDKPCKVDYREMCSAFARKVTMFTYGIRRRNQMQDLADRYPMWRFIADDRDRMPEHCRELNGKIFRYDDPFWETHYPPCEWPECSCRVELIM
jgi:SPP1 gp7 family putative phage head morphogenesis protein